MKIKTKKKFTLNGSPFHFFFAAILLLLLLVSCQKTIDDPADPHNLSDVPLAFCAGGFQSLTGFSACYWHDTTQVNLPCPGYEAIVNAITVENGVVYCGGVYRNAAGRRKACYWIDTTFYDVTNSTTEIETVTCIAYSEGTVYMAGSYQTGNMANPCYWKGNERISLNWDHDCLGYNIKSMCIDAGTVYCCASQGYYPHFYWSGTAQTKITGDPGGLNCIRVSGGTITCAGYQNEFSGLYSTLGQPTPFPCYWENKPLPNRTLLSGYEEASGMIYCSTPRGKILLAGTRRTPLVQGGIQNACYWEGPTRTDVPEVASIEAIAIVDGVVMYVANHANASPYYCYWNGNGWNTLVGEKPYKCTIRCFAFRN